MLPTFIIGLREGVDALSAVGRTLEAMPKKAKLKKLPKLPMLGRLSN
jgi:hypothetical protein